MKTIDEKRYQDWKAKNAPKPNDPMGGYGMACFLVAEKWAELLEQQIPAEADRSKVQEVIRLRAEETYREADAIPEGGLTGFQYGMMIEILAVCWVHGEELRRWHNLATQIGNEGEQANENGTVLNPALLSVKL